MRKPLPIGARFGRLVVVGRADSSPKTGQSRVAVRCDCGVEKEVYRCDLVAGKTKSCGCLRREMLTVHGRARTAEYQIWQGMLQRCRPDGGHPRYAGRGIRVCERWQESFEAFIEDMGPRPRGMTVERKDNDGDYEPGNCRWATRAEQVRNRSHQTLVTVEGVTRPLFEWADESGLNPATIRHRLRAGWPPGRAVSEPAQARKRRTS